MKCLLLPEVLLTAYSLFIYKTHKKSYLKGKKKCKWPLNIWKMFNFSHKRNAVKKFMEIKFFTYQTGKKSRSLTICATYIANENCKMAQSLWRWIWKYLAKLPMHLPFHHVTLVSGTQKYISKNKKTYAQGNSTISSTRRLKTSQMVSQYITGWINYSLYTLMNTVQL